MKTAVIGIGSNSIRMLQVDIRGGSYERLSMDREPTRLFAGLDAEGNLTEESMRKTAAVVERFAAQARSGGCEAVHIFATSASRDAKNGQVFLSLLEDLAGTKPVIISGEEEGVLSFLGATRVVSGTPRCGVVDIGGGSTELVLGQGTRIDLSLSCQMGAVRLFRRLPIACEGDMVAVEQDARGILKETLAHTELPKDPPETWIGTGGTFTVLGAMVRGLDWRDRSAMHGAVVERERAREIGRQLAGLSLAERRKLQGLQPARADIVVHGICILLSVMDTLNIPRITVSECGNLDGYVRKYCLG